MNRDQKSYAVKKLNETFSCARFAIVVDYHGLKVAALEKLRKNLRKNDAQLQIAKNTLLRIAVKDTACALLQDFFVGNTAFAVAFAEPVSVAKALTSFTAEFDAFAIRAAVLDGKLLNVNDVYALSKLPGREELLSQLLGTINAVPTGFVRLLHGVPQKMLYALSAIKMQKEN